MARGDNNRDRNSRVNRRGRDNNRKRSFEGKPSNSNRRNNAPRNSDNKNSRRGGGRRFDRDEKRNDRNRPIRKGQVNKRHVKRSEKLNEEEMEIKLNNQLSNYFKETTGNIISRRKRC